VKERAGNIGQIIDALPHLLHAQEAGQPLLDQVEFVGPRVKDRFHPEIERKFIALHVDAEFAPVNNTNRTGAYLKTGLAQGAILAFDISGGAPIGADAALEADLPAIENIRTALFTRHEAEKIGNGLGVLPVNVGLGADGIRNAHSAGLIGHVGTESGGDGGGTIDIGEGFAGRGHAGIPGGHLITLI